jgi:ribonuclease III
MNFDNHIDWKELEKKIEYKIGDKNLFLKAFTHRSFLNENQNYHNNSNERLEFLGDAILQFLISEQLFSNYSNEPEGKLTNFRAATVNTTSLAQESLRLDFGKYLLMSIGEEQTGGRMREYILANTFESVLGALYIDSNDINICRNYLKKNLFYKIDDIVKNNEYRDSKSSLQEMTQEKFSLTPVYKIIKSEGPDHDKTFTIGVYINSELLAKGVGPSKQKAEQVAAELALIQLNKKIN